VATTQTAEDRLRLVREQLQELDLRDRLDDARGRAEHLRDDALDRAGDVRDRAEDLRDEVRDRVPELLEDLEPAARKAQVTMWVALRHLIAALLVLPRVLVRVLGALPRLVEGAEKLFRDAEKQGGELAERARDAAGSVPTVKRLRRRRRTQLAAWTAGGFALGAVTGWLLARRRSTTVAYEATRG
jgi:hypothetical protein